MVSARTRIIVHIVLLGIVAELTGLSGDFAAAVAGQSSQDGIAVSSSAASTTVPAQPASTGTPTLSPTSTPLPGPGGRDLAMRHFGGPPPPGQTVELAEGVDFTWKDGTLEDAYLLLEWSRSGIRLATPAGRPLGRASTGYLVARFVSEWTDPIYCYVLVPVLNTVAVGLSDVYCWFPGTSSYLGPRDFTVALNQSTTASLAWGAYDPPPYDQVGVGLLAAPVGGAPTITAFPAQFATTTSSETYGLPTCYAAFYVRAGSIQGGSGILCALPGLSRFG